MVAKLQKKREKRAFSTECIVSQTKLPKGLYSPFKERPEGSLVKTYDFLSRPQHGPWAFAQPHLPLSVPDRSTSNFSYVNYTELYKTHKNKLLITDNPS